MKQKLKKIGQGLMYAYLTILGAWLIFALGFQLFFVYLNVTNQDERARNIVNQIDWKIDGTFKNDPNNIWYEGPKK